MISATRRRSIAKRLLSAATVALAAALLPTPGEALGVAPSADSPIAAQAVHYVYPDPVRRPRRSGYHGFAGVYSCAPGRVNTYLARKACGGAKFPNRFY